MSAAQDEALRRWPHLDENLFTERTFEALSSESRELRGTFVAGAEWADTTGLEALRSEATALMEQAEKVYALGDRGMSNMLAAKSKGFREAVEYIEGIR